MNSLEQNKTNTDSDYPRQRYEHLRSSYCNSGDYTVHDFAVRFCLFGFYGLFFTLRAQEYTAEYYHSQFIHWCGKKDPALEALYDAYRQILHSTDDY